MNPKIIIDFNSKVNFNKTIYIKYHYSWKHQNYENLNINRNISLVLVVEYE